MKASGRAHDPVKRRPEQRRRQHHTGDIQGTYTVNPDCTGSMSRNVSLGVTAHDDFVIDDGG
jgi:hypothetical protein